MAKFDIGLRRGWSEFPALPLSQGHSASPGPLLPLLTSLEHQALPSLLFYLTFRPTVKVP